MDRRNFLKTLAGVAALAPFAHLSAKSGMDKVPAEIKKTGKVDRRKYKDTAVSLPLLGFGMMRLPRLANGKIDEKKAADMVDAAMKSGLNHFDTAHMYHKGESEKFIGKVLSKYPRKSYTLASKMPWYAKDAAGVEKIFFEQLKRCNTSYFDFYMIHSLGRKNWATAERLKTYDFLLKMKKEGKIRFLGFSFHDKPEVLEEIVKAKKWDFALIQINALDWKNYKSKEQYEILTKNNIPVMVMEPLRGGSLTKLNKHATEILKNKNKDASVASWMFRFTGTLPNVLCVLSGMSKMEHLEENIKTFTSFKPLTETEKTTLSLAIAAYQKRLAVPCTACRYCLPCPAGVNIPAVFTLYNEYKLDGNRKAFLKKIKNLPAETGPEECVNCGKCMKHCPQHIQIAAELKKIKEDIAKG